MMNVSEQGTREPNRQHNLVTPRVLVFLTSVNPDHGGREVLLLKGAPAKRLWANKYNGLGGHVEATEDVRTAAIREVKEESGIEVEDLSLRGVITIDTGSDADGRRPGVLMFVFVGETDQRPAWQTAEGAPEWLPVAELGSHPLLDDLYQVLPRALEGPFFYGHYTPQPDGTLHFAFFPATR